MKATEAARRLAPLYGPAPETTHPFSPDELDRLTAHWDRLEALGFELEVRRDSLRVQNRAGGYETVIQLSRGDDLGERRALHRSLRAAFGSASDRHLAWLFQPSRAITDPCDALRGVVEVCQAVRQRPPRA
ncbi:MAG: hypothetical protein ACYDA8_23085 [Deferrisomatales bacterium]